jgi:hypothetical protein
LDPSDATELRRGLCVEVPGTGGLGFNRSIAAADRALATTCPDRDR